MFKYLPPDRIDVLENNLICFNNPLNFNDPFEFYANFNSVSFNAQLQHQLSNMNIMDYIPNELRIIFDKLPKLEQDKILSTSKYLLPNLFENHKDSIDNYIHGVYSSALQEIIKTTRVLCLSERKDNILMWSHYTNSHEGFVLEFDVSDDFFNQKRSEKDEYGYLRKVKYDDCIPNIDPYSKKSNFSYFLIKSHEWSYEDEWRMLLPEKHSSSKVSFQEKTFDLYTYPAKSIKSITLGCKSSLETENKIKRILNHKKYASVQLFKSSLSKTRFELDFFNA